MEALEKSIADLRTHVDGKIDKAIKGLENSVSDKVDPLLKAEIKSMTDLLEKKEAELKKGLDKLDAQIQKGLISKEKAQKGFAELLGEHAGKEEFKNAWESSHKAGFELELTGKAVGTMTTSASLTGEVIAPDRRASIVELAQRRTHIRSLLPQGTMTSDVYRYNKETAGEGGVDVTAEAASKNQVDYDLSATDANVKKITGFVRISMELLEDLPAMSDFLSRRLTKDIRTKEDQQLLFGTGSGNQLTGLNAAPTTFAAYYSDSTATIIDLMIAAAASLADLNYEANGIALNPKDYYQLFTAKSSQGEYVINSLLQVVNNQMFIAGIPVFMNTAVTQGTYFIGDWINGAQIFDRMGVNVRFSEDDSDNFTKNLVTVRAEERLAFPIYYPDSFIYGTITTDINKIKNYT